MFVRRYYGTDAVVVNDIGAMMYFTNARVLDMFGLGDIEPVRIRRAQGGRYTADDVEQWTAPYRPTVAVLQLGWGWVPPRVPAAWTKVAEIALTDSGQTLGFFAVNADAARPCGGTWRRSRAAGAARRIPGAPVVNAPSGVGALAPPTARAFPVPRGPRDRPSDRRQLLAVLLSAAYWALCLTASFEVAERWRPVHGLRVTAFSGTEWTGRVDPRPDRRHAL